MQQEAASKLAATRAAIRISFMVIEVNDGAGANRRPQNHVRVSANPLAAR